MQARSNDLAARVVKGEACAARGVVVRGLRATTCGRCGRRVGGTDAAAPSREMHLATLRVVGLCALASTACGERRRVRSPMPWPSQVAVVADAARVTLADGTAFTLAHPRRVGERLWGTVTACEGAGCDAVRSARGVAVADVRGFTREGGVSVAPESRAMIPRAPPLLRPPRAPRAPPPPVPQRGHIDLVVGGGLYVPVARASYRMGGEGMVALRAYSRIGFGLSVTLRHGIPVSEDIFVGTGSVPPGLELRTAEITFAYRGRLWARRFMEIALLMQMGGGWTFSRNVAGRAPTCRNPWSIGFGPPQPPCVPPAYTEQRVGSGSRYGSVFGVGFDARIGVFLAGIVGTWSWTTNGVDDVHGLHLDLFTGVALP